MLIIGSQLNDRDRAKCEQAGWLAYDPVTGAYLRFVEDDRGIYIFMVAGMAQAIYASSEQDALVQANRSFMK